MNWSSAQLAEATKKATGVAQVAPKPTASTTEPPQASRDAQGQEKAKCEILTSPGPETRLIGPYALSLADPKHYPGRHRHTVTGPATPGLTDALEAALLAFHQAHPTRRDASGGDSRETV